MCKQPCRNCNNPTRVSILLKRFQKSCYIYTQTKNEIKKVPLYIHTNKKWNKKGPTIKLNYFQSNPCVASSAEKENYHVQCSRFLYPVLGPDTELQHHVGKSVLPFPAFYLAVLLFFAVCSSFTLLVRLFSSLVTVFVCCVPTMCLIYREW